MTGIFTGRSPKDKYLVVDENSKEQIQFISNGITIKVTVPKLIIHGKNYSN
jgi:ATP-dependent phosphoenolpyruvate carboxykinase